MMSNGILSWNSKTKIGHISDGSSNTYLVGESIYMITPSGSRNTTRAGWASSARTDSSCTPVVLAGAVFSINSGPGSGSSRDGWSSSTDARNVASATFGSEHTGGCNMALGDGSVRFISENINLQTHWSLGAKADGLVLGEF
jgi:prepilin-type processing-associated H-X9-DG protein